MRAIVIACVDLRKQGHSCKRIAEALGLTVSAVKTHIQRSGIDCGDAWQLENKYRAAVIKLYENGKTLNEIRDELGVGTEIIRKLLLGSGFDTKSNLESWRKRPKTDIAKEVVKLRTRGLKQHEIKKALRLPRTTISSICQRYIGKEWDRENLTDSLKAEIVRRYVVDKQSTPQIALELGLTQGNVYQFLKRKGLNRSRTQARAIRSARGRGL